MALWEEISSLPYLLESIEVLPSVNLWASSGFKVVRAAEKHWIVGHVHKRATTSNQVASTQETSRTQTPDIQNMTVERLRALLKEKKDELIARLKGSHD
ncbi:hypothetical protein HAX54_024466 [Datura stramonium]|uniref:Uncharacterized protein n=1 Tax=Datura stramonium TaxID=4076 RepID=A0ABS8V041_DATST|nr:hypothetical protein [Datura stramonium]